MKTHKRLLLALSCLAGLLPLSAGADLLSPDMNAKDAIGRVDSMETKNGLSAQFWLTADEQVFAAWARAGAIRDLKPTLQAKRNVPIFVALFLANPGIRAIMGPDGRETRLCNVTFDLYVIDPNGTLTMANKQRTAWKGEPPPPGLINLAKDKNVLNFEAIDSLGQYTVILIVHDLIRHIDMKLSRKVELMD